MRLYKFGIIALVIGLWGCAADYEPEETRGDGATVSLTLDINVSGSGETRANDDFEHGDDSEFAVTEACVALFSGDNESDAEFIGAFPLTNETTTAQESGAAVSSVHRMTAKVPHEVTKGPRQMYALAFVNYSGVMTLNETDGSLDFKGDGTFRPYKKQTASEMMKLRITNAYSRMLVNGRIFMTNAPVSDKPGGNSQPGKANVSTLVSIDMAKINVADEPCCFIFVERALAKINVRFNPQILQDKLTVPGPDGKSKVLGITNIEWWLDDPHCAGNAGKNNASSYLVRNVGNVSDYINHAAGSGNFRYRFVGKTPLADYNGKNKAFCINWAVDPDYDTDVTNVDYRIPHRYGIKWNKPGQDSETGDVIYAPENTFDVSHMNYRNSPRIIVRVKYSTDANTAFSDEDTEDLFLLNGNEKSIYTVEEIFNVGMTIMNRDAQWKNWLKTHNYTKTQQYDFAFFYPEISGSMNEATFPLSYGGSVTFGYNSKKARIGRIFGLKVQNGQWVEDSDFAADSDMGKHLTQLVDSALDMDIYAYGYAYYEIRLKHFGDEYTPAGDAGYGQVTVDEAYGGDNAKYLGRYGMVRNNWYDVYINSIEDLGEPHIPESTLPDDPRYDYPDDYSPAYMGVQINLMPWTRRDQHLKF